jgi:hypothetical protein
MPIGSATCKPSRRTSVPSGSCGRSAAATIRELAVRLSSARTGCVYARVGVCQNELGPLASWLVASSSGPSADRCSRRRRRARRTGRDHGGDHAGCRLVPAGFGRANVNAITDELQIEPIIGTSILNGEPVRITREEGGP